MDLQIYTLAIAHPGCPAAEIFTPERDALDRRLSLSEVSEEQRERLLRLFDSADRPAYEEALNRLESQVSLVCAIEAHDTVRL